MEKQRTRRPDEMDDLLAVLADHGRRIVIDYLRDAPTGTATVDELVAQVDARGHHPDGRQRVVLHHSILPKLDEAGVVDYDPDRGHVEYRGHERLEAMLEALEDVNRRAF